MVDWEKNEKPYEHKVYLYVLLLNCYCCYYCYYQTLLHFKVLLKSFWPIHIDEFFKSPYKMKSNDTKFTMIEKAILILLMICFSDWWRHLLFSLIRKTLDNQYFRKILGNKTLCKQNIFLKKVQSYKQKYTIIIFS